MLGLKLFWLSILIKTYVSPSPTSNNRRPFFSFSYLLSTFLLSFRTCSSLAVLGDYHSPSRSFYEFLKQLPLISLILIQNYLLWIPTKWVFFFLTPIRLQAPPGSDLMILGHFCSTFCVHLCQIHPRWMVEWIALELSGCNLRDSINLHHWFGWSYCVGRFSIPNIERLNE